MTEAAKLKPKCEGSPKTFTGYCERPASVEVNGKAYCWQHRPKTDKDYSEARKLRIEKNARQEKEWEDKERRSKLEKDAGIHNLPEADLIFLASLGGIREVINQLQNN